MIRRALARVLLWLIQTAIDGLDNHPAIDSLNRPRRRG